MVESWASSFNTVLKSPYLVYDIYIYIITYIYITYIYMHQISRQYQMWYCNRLYISIFMHIYIYIYLYSYLCYISLHVNTHQPAEIPIVHDAKATGVAPAALGGCHLCSSGNRWTRRLGKTSDRDFPCFNTGESYGKCIVYIYIYVYYVLIDLVIDYYIYIGMFTYIYIYVYRYSICVYDMYLGVVARRGPHAKDR